MSILTKLPEVNFLSIVACQDYGFLKLKCLGKCKNPHVTFFIMKENEQNFGRNRLFARGTFWEISAFSDVFS